MMNQLNTPQSNAQSTATITTINTTLSTKQNAKVLIFCLLTIALIAASFYSLDLQWGQFLSANAASKMSQFIAELLQPNLSAKFLSKLLPAALETLAMSALGTVLAAILAMVLALWAAQQTTHSTTQSTTQRITNSTTHSTTQSAAKNRSIRAAFSSATLNALRSIPELVWAALLLISAGLGPFAGTLALMLHTAGVLGRLFTEALENAPQDASFALRHLGASNTQVFTYATLPTVLPQLLSYTLYRWENNIRAAAVLGVVGAGGLGQLLSFHLSLFQMAETSTVLLAMLVLIVLVDSLSVWLRRVMTAP